MKNITTTPPLTLFDVALLDAHGRDAAVRARRARALARLARRRYTADADAYELMEQTRRRLHLVT